MHTKIFALLSEHSVAIAILVSNIISAIIISRMSSRDKLVQNQLQVTKDTLHVLLQVIQKLETLLTIDISKSSNGPDSIKALNSKIILDCKKVMHLISDLKADLPGTMETCRKLHDFLSAADLEELDFLQFKSATSGFYAQLNKNIEDEWIDV